MCVNVMSMISALPTVIKEGRCCESAGFSNLYIEED